MNLPRGMVESFFIVEENIIGRILELMPMTEILRMERGRKEKRCRPRECQPLKRQVARNLLYSHLRVLFTGIVASRKDKKVSSSISSWKGYTNYAYEI